MYLQEAPWHKAAVTLLVYGQRNRVEEEYPSQTGVQGSHIANCNKKTV